MPVREFELGPATRDAYGDALCELGAADPRIVALEADLSKSTKSGKFGKRFPPRRDLAVAGPNLSRQRAEGKVP